ncbi:HAMP domain-containing histidine kinase [Caproiciproducens sp. NJN-50]|uniref:HAMP domain-containing sensor histidine kinase n=1 Tax=Acutalibacteraceae TaxID=3082771 RepID=UPI000FFDFAF5|nr:MULTISPECIES: HAMP domain-containing sensor histidine kinase [Acutalibacteraceae]QAT49466.1 HAMP domain-containing histidine kinase [Caproiciproducens sp. NJN-50]
MDRLKKAFYNLSLKKSFMLYMLLFLLLATALSSVSINLADSVKNRINFSYADTDNKYTVSNRTGSVVIFSPPPEYTPKDQEIITVCNAVQIGSVPLFFGFCIVMAALFFYRNKLKKPIELLDKASGKIASNDLDFHLSYDSRDEMGQLCTSFETMREALRENNLAMWRAVEERKRLNAAFSHDLRTPLTVLRGYTDFLKNYLPQGKVTEEKLLSTISTMSGHIARLENYVRQMGEIQKLEDVTAHLQDVEIGALAEQLQSAAALLVKDSGLTLDFTNEIKQSHMTLDPSIVMRVYENLISNAIRYARDTVRVRLQCEGETFCVGIADDGQGFSEEDLQMALRPYYKRKSDADQLHFGLGLYICKTLCEKHGGAVAIRNSRNGGAVATAGFLAK